MGDVAECKHGPEVAELRTLVLYLMGTCGPQCPRALIARMLGVALPVHMMSAPQNAAELPQIFGLLELLPQWRERLPEMAEVSGTWAAIVENWEELERLDRVGSETKDWRPLNQALGRALASAPEVWP